MVNSPARRFWWMLTGAVLLVVIVAVGAWAACIAGLIPVNADSNPSALEFRAARLARNAVTHRASIEQQADPLPYSDANLDAGIKLYGTNCMVCHGASDGKPSNVAMGLYQHPPQFGRHGVEDDPEGVTYWVVTHGIRFTGMPAFDAGLTDTEIWQLTMFLKHMDALPPQPQAAWKRFTAAHPARRAPALNHIEALHHE
jgi:thiosulfate dehydrogenase